MTYNYYNCSTLGLLDFVMCDYDIKKAGPDSCNALELSYRPDACAYT